MQKMEQFDTVQMASGGLALVLEPSCGWENFPPLSEQWIARLHARALSTPIIGVDACLVEVDIAGGRFWIAYDDFQGGLHLEPTAPAFNGIVTSLRDALRSGI